MEAPLLPRAWREQASPFVCWSEEKRDGPGSILLTQWKHSNNGDSRAISLRVPLVKLLLTAAIPLACLISFSVVIKVLFSVMVCDNFLVSHLSNHHHGLYTDLCITPPHRTRRLKPNQRKCISRSRQRNPQHGLLAPRNSKRP